MASNRGPLVRHGTQSIWHQPPLSSNNVLARIITELIQAFADSQDTVSNPKLTILVNERGVASIANKVLEGVGLAGVYHVLQSDG